MSATAAPPAAATRAPSPLQQRAARIAGASFLFAVVGVMYANFGLRGPLLVGRDPAETIRRVSGAQEVFRMSVLLDVGYCIGVAVALVSFYVILRDVNRYVALVAGALKAVYLGTALLTALAFYHVSRLSALSVEPGRADPDHIRSAVQFALSSTGEQYYLGLVFWSLSVALCAWLWRASGYVPRWFATMGLASAFWCAFCPVAYLRDPAFARVVNLWWFDVPMELFEMGLSALLLARGLPRSSGDFRAEPADHAADQRRLVR